ncbi:Vacuolar amino acid transporter 6 [Cucumispora dikerogammari]|nr:Vacuolar amino acid transporter 6 [Cucumispora dikerogammari]
MNNPFIICYLNLIKAITGTGLIFYPIYFNKLGFFPTIIGILISSIFSQIGLYILCYVNNKKGPKSISGLANLYKTKSIRKLSDLIVISKTLLVAISYLKLLSKYLNNLFNIKKEILLIFILCILLYPLVSLKQIKSLKFASLIAVSATIYLILLICYKTVRSDRMNLNDLNWDPCTIKEFLNCVPFFVFSFTAHHTIITMQNDYFNKNIKFFFFVIVCANTTVGGIYFLFGILFNKLFNIKDYNFDSDCLNAFPRNRIEFWLARIGYILLICFSIPLQLIPCRKHLIDVFFKKKFKPEEFYLIKNSNDENKILEYKRETANTYNYLSDSDSLDDTDSLNDSDTISNKSENNIINYTDNNNIIRYGFSVGILCFVFLIYCLPIDLHVFQKVTGGTCSTVLCFILPMILLRKVGNVNKSILILGWLSVLYGIFVFSVFCFGFL